jgi:ketosteroid isomerase-like protein
MKRLLATLAVCAPLATTAPAAEPNPRLDALRQEVWRTEEAFAKTMADRDFAAFQTFLSAETVFWSNGIRRGPAAVAEVWKAFYEGPAAPFSWKPDTVEVLDSGALAFSSGPVFAPDGARVSTFNSVWRKEADGKWRVVFDKGCPPCGAPK